MEFEADTPVLVKYPLTKEQEKSDRAAWPWMPGMIEEVCSADEWFVVVTDRAVATAEDGSPAPADADDEDVWFPMCFRGSSELRAVSQ
jgi:uncharacterized cupin superfamily protein